MTGGLGLSVHPPPTEAHPPPPYNNCRIQNSTYTHSVLQKLLALSLSVILPVCCIAQQSGEGQWDKYQPRTIASIIRFNEPLCKEMDSSPQDQGKKKILLTADSSFLPSSH